MKLTFYFVPMSTSTITEGVLAELDVPYERVKLDIANGDTREPQFLELNPNGRVPVIVHDGTPIWESSAITMYLGEVFGAASGLYPPTGPRRGEAMKWIAWGNVVLAEAAGRLSASLPADNNGAVLTTSRDYVPPENRSALDAEKAMADLIKTISVLDGALHGREFLLGEYTLADTHLFGFVGWSTSMGLDLAPFVNVAAWLQRCGARPALAQLMEG